MKKLNYIIVAFVLIASFAKAQIPNNGFESWTNVGSYEIPDNWGTMNGVTSKFSVYTATKATPGNPGTSYLKLTSKMAGTSVVNGMAVSGELDTITKQPLSGFAFTQRPQYFTGKWQHMIYGSSQGSLFVKLTRWNTSTNMRETIATASQTLSGMAMSWANFSITFNYVNGNAPDTCIIILKASGTNPTANDYLWVDNLAFTGTVAGIEEANAFLNNISIYPNPTSNVVSIDVDFKSAQQTTIELLDINGKLISSKQISIPQGKSKQMLDVTNVSKGTYFVNMKTSIGKETKKIIVE